MSLENFQYYQCFSLRQQFGGAIPLYVNAYFFSLSSAYYLPYKSYLKGENKLNTSQARYIL